MSSCWDHGTSDVGCSIKDWSSAAKMCIHGEERTESSGAGVGELFRHLTVIGDVEQIPWGNFLHEEKLIVPGYYLQMDRASSPDSSDAVGVSTLPSGYHRKEGPGKCW